MATDKSDTEATLLDHLRANPDDETGWGAYADYVQEHHSEEWAATIRATCITKADPGPEASVNARYAHAIHVGGVKRARRDLFARIRLGEIMDKSAHDRLPRPAARWKPPTKSEG